LWARWNNKERWGDDIGQHLKADVEPGIDTNGYRFPTTISMERDTDERRHQAASSCRYLEGNKMTERTYDRIKAFSTEVPVTRTIAEIERMLAKYGASHIMKEYDGELPIRLVFAINTDHGKLGVKLPVRPEKILVVFKKQVSDGKLPRKYWDGDWAREQANRVAWRIVKEWLDAQLTLLNAETAKLEEMFLSYVYNEKLDMTVYEMLEKNKFNLDMLEAHDGHPDTDKKGKDSP